MRAEEFEPPDDDDVMLNDGSKKSAGKQGSPKVFELLNADGHRDGRSRRSGRMPEDRKGNEK